MDYASKKRQVRPPLVVEPLLLVAVVLLLGVSLVMVYSTTGVVCQERYGDAFYYLKRQGFAVAVGLPLMFFSSFFDVERLRSISPAFYFIGFSLLLLTLLPFFGVSAGGAQRWIGVAGFRFQPGELVKLFFIIFIAGYFSRHETALASFGGGIVKPMLLFGLFALLYLMQPDFGSVVAILCVTLIMGLAAGVRLLHMAICGIGCLGVLGVLVAFSPYRMRRILAFMSPLSDPEGKGYQLIQSLIAVGNGMFSGVGLGSSQQKLFFLPAAHTDFIFAVIAEELGFIGCLGLFTLFLIILWRGLAVAARLADDTFRFCLAVGLTMLICVPAFLNVGIVTGLLPTKGMVLPFVGYGGSSLLVSLLAMGLLLSLSRSVYR
jgi:cell division protein FtsW